MSSEHAPLHLTDFLDLATLQEIQDSFAAVANVKARITDADGNPVTSPLPGKEFVRRQWAIEQAEETEGPSRDGREYVAPIVVEGQRVGTIRIVPEAGTFGLDEARVASLAERFGLDVKQFRSLLSTLARTKKTKTTAIQFVYLLANAIARLCYQEYQLRQRVSELTTVYDVTMALADARDLNEILQRAARLIVEHMNVKASSIRLIDSDHDELITKAVFNLSAQYVDKGPIRLSKSEIDRAALSEQGFAYVRDMGADPRVQYPGEAAREGIHSMISVGMHYKGHDIGVLRLYTETETTFSPIQIDLLKALAAQAAAAIENARLYEDSIAAAALEKQVQMAGDVQQRMVPQHPPQVNGLDLASVYVPCYTLGGDLYDFIPLPYDNVGLVVADVSGKGVPASLIMASVRASLRAQVDNVFYLDEIMRRLNVMLTRDTKAGEFVTLFYGVLDAPNRRLTYCNAGHPPPLVKRRGEIIELQNDNLVLGVSEDEQYVQRTLDFQPDDVLLMYTDGLADAMDFRQQTFGNARVKEAFLQTDGNADTIANGILWEMRKYAGMSKRTDDVTMIVAKVH